MSGKQPMVYAYFRFYADDNDIVNGLKPFCTDIIRLSNSGYNYKEYRCWVDNAGGLESWIGTQHGYITSERETGFLDAAPSDSIYDNTIVMGKQKLLLDDLRYLHVFKPPLNLYIRKIVATHTASGLYKYNFGNGIAVEHPFYLTLDSTLVEQVTFTDTITKSSTVDTESTTVDVAATLHPVTYHSFGGGVVNPERAFNGIWDDYARIDHSTGTKYITCDLGSIKQIYNICLKGYHNRCNGARQTLKVWSSLDNVSWDLVYTIYTNVQYTNIAIAEHDVQDLDIQARYIKVEEVTTSSPTPMSYTYIHNLIVS